MAKHRSTSPESNPRKESNTNSPRPLTFNLNRSTSGVSSAKAPKHKPPLSHSSKAESATKRPHRTLQDSDDDDDQGANQNHNEPQHVATFDQAAGGAISISGPEEAKGPLVITSQKNRDWREESRRLKGRSGKNLLPPEVQQARARADKGTSGPSQDDTVNGAAQAYGLSFVAKQADPAVDTLDESRSEEQQSTKTNPSSSSKPKTDDDLALEALTNGNERKKSDLILPAVPTPSNDDDDDDVSPSRLPAAALEDDSFKADVSSRPESASLEQYLAVPVEEFGAAMLRGMGWKEGQEIGKRRSAAGASLSLMNGATAKGSGKAGGGGGGSGAATERVKQRPALLGIGAKEEPQDLAEELGAWGKGARKGPVGPNAAAAMAQGNAGKRRKIEKTYTPVMMRHAKTGEMVTEEEMRKRVDASKMMLPPLGRGGGGDDDEAGGARRGKADKTRRDRRAGSQDDDNDADDRRLLKAAMGSDRRDGKPRLELEAGSANGTKSSKSSRRDRSRSADRDGHRRRHHRGHDDNNDNDDDRHRRRRRHRDREEEDGKDRRRRRDNDAYDDDHRRKRRKEKERERERERDRR